MNTQQIKGKAKEIAGEIQEHAGRFIGNKEQEKKGHNKEMKGKIEKSLGDLKDKQKH